MQTALHQSVNSRYTGTSSQSSFWSQFITYCTRQEKNRLLWVGIALAAHGCALTPITVMVTLFAGPNLFLFMSAMVAMGIVLVTNLAGMPTKVTIPAFALSLVIDTAVLVSCAFLSFR